MYGIAKKAIQINESWISLLGGAVADLAAVVLSRVNKWNKMPASTISSSVKRPWDDIVMLLHSKNGLEYFYFFFGVLQYTDKA